MNITIEDLKNMINEYSENEFGEEYLFNEHPLDKLPIMYSTIGDDEEVSMELVFDIINHKEFYYANGKLIYVVSHKNADEMYEANVDCTFGDFYGACVDIHYNFGG